MISTTFARYGSVWSGVDDSCISLSCPPTLLQLGRDIFHGALSSRLFGGMAGCPAGMAGSAGSVPPRRSFLFLCHNQHHILLELNRSRLDACRLVPTHATMAMAMRSGRAAHQESLWNHHWNHENRAVWSLRLSFNNKRDHKKRRRRGTFTSTRQRQRVVFGTLVVESVCHSGPFSLTYIERELHPPAFATHSRNSPSAAGTKQERDGPE